MAAPDPFAASNRKVALPLNLGATLQVPADDTNQPSPVT
jgi:hypothetical protein